MATTTRRANRYPVLADNPDVPRDIGNLAADLDDAPGYNAGLIAARPGSGRFIGDIYWATDDLAMGANGSPYVWQSSGWRLMSHANDPAAGTAGARTLGAGAAQAAAGNDSRLSDARIPTAHAASHRAGGSDALSSLALNGIQVRDVGEANNIRAARVLTAADFTALGLSAPFGLWNLGDLTDASGNTRTLVNKGSVTFGPGVRGAATEAAIFAGVTTQSLYNLDTGAGDALRLKSGSFGCWFRTAKRGTAMALVSKWGAAAANQLYILTIQGNVVTANVGDGTTTTPTAVGTTDVADERWHFAVATFDNNKLRVYVDGALESYVSFNGPIISAAADFNIGSNNANAGTAASLPFFGRIDEAFATGDVLSEEQVRNLYCARITHSLAVTPVRANVNVKRRRRGGVLQTTDFPSTPLRLYNFTAGALTDAGSNATAVAPGGGGTITDVNGADGLLGGGKYFAGAHTGLLSTDTGLPAGTTARSYGLWIKTAAVGAGIMMWGTVNTADAGLGQNANGTLISYSAADTMSGFTNCSDGFWHHVVIVEDNAAVDGLKRKMYIDGRLNATSTVLNAITLAGAGTFKIGARASIYGGHLDSVFVIGAVLTPEQVRALYNVGSQALASSPRSEGENIEAIEAASILATFDVLEGCDIIDLQVAA